MTYSDILAKTTKPSTIQCRSFTQDIWSFHSWYKHLDRINGNRFVFFLDPEGTPAQKKGIGDRRPDPFHHDTELYRSEYVRRYGYINYSVLEPWEQPQVSIEFQNESISIPTEVVQKQSCLLFPYCYNANQPNGISAELVEWSLHEWANTNEQRLYQENRPFIRTALNEWHRIKESTREQPAHSLALQRFYRSLITEEMKKVEHAIQAILAWS